LYNSHDTNLFEKGNCHVRISPATIDTHPLLVFTGGGSRSRQSRLRRFCKWHQATGRVWYKPDLAIWRDQLIDGR
jgi:hypothetical protein